MADKANLLANQGQIPNCMGIVGEFGEPKAAFRVGAENMNKKLASVSALIG